jgi:hypothetical protein
MSIKQAIDSKDHERVCEMAEKLLSEGPADDTLFFLQHAKLVSLINLDKLDLSQNYFKALESTFRKSSDFSLISNYFAYKNEKYSDVVNNLKSSPWESLGIAQQLLLAQAETKLENFLAGFVVFWNLYKEKRVPEELVEDCLINALNCVVLMLLTEDRNSPVLADKRNLSMFADLISLLTRTPVVEFVSRESQINVLLLFVVIEKLKPADLYSFYKRLAFDFQSQASQMLATIEHMIKQDVKGDSSNANDSTASFVEFKGDKLIDHLTLFSLRTFVMQQNQEIVWNANDIRAIESLLFEKKNAINDDHLRISLMSFLTFIYSVADAKNTLQINQLLVKIEEEIRGLPKGLKRSVFLSKHLFFNKVILQLHNDNLTEARKTAKNELRMTDREINYFYLPIETQIIVKGRNPKELENKVNAFDKGRLSVDPSYACMFYLFQLTVFYNWNNQLKYSNVFLDFINDLFIRQLSVPEDQRFLQPTVFNQFAKHVVFFMIRNNTLLKNMKDKIVRFIDYVGDQSIVLKMANLFVEKREFQVAETILSGLVAKDPTNDRVRSRLNYVYSIVDPSKIDEGVLPRFELLQDINSIRNLENDFMNIVRQKTSAKTDSTAPKVEDTKITKEKSGRRKIKKKYRIKWPKNFDFSKPGPRPDPERWLPKFERKKYLKRAVRDGKVSRTQGVTTTSNNNKELFKAEYSTASQDVVKKNQRRGN